MLQKDFTQNPISNTLVTSEKKEKKQNSSIGIVGMDRSYVRLEIEIDLAVVVGHKQRSLVIRLDRRDTRQPERRFSHSKTQTHSIYNWK